MGDFLDAVDSAIKRLATAVLIFIAAAAIEAGAGVTGQDLDFWVYAISAFGGLFFLMSMFHAITQIMVSSIPRWLKWFAGFSFVGVYIGVFGVCLATGFQGVEKAFSALF